MAKFPFHEFQIWATKHLNNTQLDAAHWRNKGVTSNEAKIKDQLFKQIRLTSSFSRVHTVHMFRVYSTRCMHVHCNHRNDFFFYLQCDELYESEIECSCCPVCLIASIEANGIQSRSAVKKCPENIDTIPFGCVAWEQSKNQLIISGDIWEIEHVKLTFKENWEKFDI